MKYNRIIKTGAAVCATILLANSCIKENSENSNIETKAYLEAWMATNYPSAQKTALGVYIVEDVPGSGEAYSVEGENYFVMADYTVTSLDGTITGSTSEAIAKQLGTYSTSTYYGPKYLINYEGQIPEGVADMLVGMKPGGKRKAMIPTWLLGSKRYSTPEEYLKHETGTASCFYTIEYKFSTKNPLDIEILNLAEYADKHLGVDSLSYGFYYKQTKAPTDDTAFSKDTTIYINYIGRLLNGKVFDTNIADTAKFYNIYSSSNKYVPMGISWSETEDGLKAKSSGSESSLVSGFNKTLWQMKAGEEGIGAFYSPLGYSYSGSGNSIPPYSPLIFQIFMTTETK